MLLTSDSPLNEHPPNIDIQLKNHQLAMLKRCLDIEQSNQSHFGIMNDKPGTGKTYVILSLIYQNILNNASNQVKNTNIIIVPQNIYTQWLTSIEKFGGNMKYIKFTNYENIMTLYNNPDFLSEYDIILTTSSYYNTISTTLSSLDIRVSRVFFDEIDSIANLVCSKIDADFIWFVSASFNIQYLGYYANKIINNDINEIICKCDSDFIDENIYLEPPIKKYYLCKNIYVDKILNDVLSKNELNRLNALDYTLNNKNFEKNKVSNEKEVINLIIKNRKEIIEFEKFQIEEAQKFINNYENYIFNKDEYKNIYQINIDKIDDLMIFKKEIVDYLDSSNFDKFLSISILSEKKSKELLSLKNIFNDLIECFYNIREIKDEFIKHISGNKTSLKIDMIVMNLKKMDIMLGSILLNFNDVKNNNDFLCNFLENVDNNKKYINDLIDSTVKYINILIAPDQLEIHKKQYDISSKTIIDNQTKVDMIYSRLEENHFCPVCFESFNSFECNHIYYTSKCCNNKICGSCINEWYDKRNKDSCIFCNKESVIKDDLLFIDNNTKNEIEVCVKINNEQTNIKKYENYENDKSQFLKNYILQLKYVDKKVIIFSDYSNVFQYIEKLCQENDINVVDLDKGNIKNIDSSVNDYKAGDAKILLSNSILFGCGMNFENSTDIIFVHKMNHDMEKQVIGRAQRLGRKSVLNIIYLEYDNENINDSKKANYYNNEDFDEELNNYYKNKQIDNLLDNMLKYDFSGVNFDQIQNNNISENNNDNNENNASSIIDLLNLSQGNQSEDYINEETSINLEEPVYRLE